MSFNDGTIIIIQRSNGTKIVIIDHDAQNILHI